MRPEQEDYALRGIVDEVIIYHSALSEAEIRDVMINGVSSAVNPDSSKLATTWGYIRLFE